MAEETRRLTVIEAADVLGLTEGAVRARIKRGTLNAEREGNTVYVRLDADEMVDRRDDQTALVDALRDQIDTLKRQLDAERTANIENRRLLAAALERIPPQLEAPQEPPEARETPSEPAHREEPFTSEERPQEAAQRRSWWRRVFGGKRGEGA
jgi:hypothetical protein